MYVDNLSGSTVYMLNGFMRQREEQYLLISDKFGLEGYGKKFYISFVLGKMTDYSRMIEKQYISSSATMSELKKVSGKKINIETVEKKLELGDLYLYNITLPVYALLKQCFNIVLSTENVIYEKLIRFEMPININAQCDNRGGYSVFQSYGETSLFPLIGFVVFDNEYITSRYDYNKIEM